MNEQLLKTSGADVLSSRKKLRKTYLDNALIDFAQTSQTSKWPLEKKLPLTILEEQFPVPRNTAANKIGNGVISVLWQTRRHCNPDQNKFLFLSNTAVVAIFP